MAKLIEINVTESNSFLRQLQKKHPSRYKPLQMLLLIKEHGPMSQYLLADMLVAGHSSVMRWRRMYKQSGLTALLKENRGGNKAAAIDEKVHQQLSQRLHNPQEGFRSFVELQQWLLDEFGVEMNYHAVNKYVKRKFGARLKVSHKSHVLKSPADEAVFKKPIRKTGTY
jgi:transposase